MTEQVRADLVADFVEVTGDDDGGLCTALHRVFDTLASAQVFAACTAPTDEYKLANAVLNTLLAARHSRAKPVRRPACAQVRAA